MCVLSQIGEGPVLPGRFLTSTFGTDGAYVIVSFSSGSPATTFRITSSGAAYRSFWAVVHTTCCAAISHG